MNIPSIKTEEIKQEYDRLCTQKEFTLDIVDLVTHSLSILRFAVGIAQEGGDFKTLPYEEQEKCVLEALAINNILRSKMKEAGLV